MWPTQRKSFISTKVADWRNRMTATSNTLSFAIYQLRQPHWSFVCDWGQALHDDTNSNNRVLKPDQSQSADKYTCSPHVGSIYSNPPTPQRLLRDLISCQLLPQLIAYITRASCWPQHLGIVDTAHEDVLKKWVRVTKWSAKFLTCRLSRIKIKELYSNCVLTTKLRRQEANECNVRLLQIMLSCATQSPCHVLWMSSIRERQRLWGATSTNALRVPSTAICGVFAAPRDS